MKIEELGVTQLTIKLPFRLNHVNCFFAEGEDGWTAVDTGLHNQEAYQAWEGLISGRQVSDIIVTHYHPDHYGFAGKLQEMTGARVSMTKIEHETAMEFAKDQRQDKMIRDYLNCGIPPKVIAGMTGDEGSFNHLASPHPEVSRYLQEGDKIKLGKLVYEVLAAPGHADGLICLFNREKSVLFSADHILPRITPNISYHFYGETDPLGSYLRSLERFKELDAEFVFPSHGKPFRNANKRIDEILAHHEERFSRIMEITKQPLSVFDICMKLFRSDMTSHDLKFAIGETISHLEYLFNRGECSKDIDNGICRYRT